MSISGVSMKGKYGMDMSGVLGSGLGAACESLPLILGKFLMIL